MLEKLKNIPTWKLAIIACLLVVCPLWLFFGKDGLLFGLAIIGGGILLFAIGAILAEILWRLDE